MVARTSRRVLALGITLLANSAALGQDSFVGTWKLTQLTVDGLQHPDSAAQDLNLLLLFSTSRVCLRQKDETGESDNWQNFHSDDTTTPKSIDFVDSATGSAELGVYEISGDDLKLCLNDDVGGTRPDSVTSPTGSVRSLYVLKRTDHVDPCANASTPSANAPTTAVPSPTLLPSTGPSTHPTNESVQPVTPTVGTPEASH